MQRREDGDQAVLVEGKKPAAETEGAAVPDICRQSTQCCDSDDGEDESIVGDARSRT